MPDHIDSFTHDGLAYNLTTVRKLLRDHKSVLLPIDSLLWIHNHDTPREDRVVKAKLRYPLIVAKWNGRWVVVDGIHRLEKYRRLGITVIPVKEVTGDILSISLIKK
jgi:hypothetical protein